jgi:hypothetical protein
MFAIAATNTYGSPHLPCVWIDFQIFHDHHDAFHLVAKALRIG